MLFGYCMLKGTQMELKKEQSLLKTSQMIVLFAYDFLIKNFLAVFVVSVAAAVLTIAINQANFSTATMVKPNVTEVVVHHDAGASLDVNKTSGATKGITKQDISKRIGDVKLDVISFVKIFILNYILLYLELVILKCMYDMYQRRSVRFVDNLLGILRMSFRIIMLSFVGSVMIVLGMFLFVLPGIYCMFTLMMAMVVLIIEEQGVIATIRRAFDLIRMRWWRTCILLIGLTLIASLCFYILALVLHTTNISLQNMRMEFLYNVLKSMVGMPLFGAILIVQYHNLLAHKKATLKAFKDKK